MSVSGPSSCFTVALFKVWTSLETYHKSGANRVHNVLFALVYLARAASSNGALLVKSPYAVGPHETRFFEELGFAAGGVGNRCNSAIVALCVYHCRVQGTLQVVTVAYARG